MHFPSKVGNPNLNRWVTTWTSSKLGKFGFKLNLTLWVMVNQLPKQESYSRFRVSFVLIWRFQLEWVMSHHTDIFGFDTHTHGHTQTNASNDNQGSHKNLRKMFHDFSMTSTDQNPNFQTKAPIFVFAALVSICRINYRQTQTHTHTHRPFFFFVP